MRIIRFSERKYTDIVDEVNNLVNIKADQKTGVIRNLTPNVSDNSALRVQELNTIIEQNTIDDTLFFHRTDPEKPNEIYGNLRFLGTPAFIVAPEIYRPASVDDIESLLNFFNINFDPETVLLRDGSRKLENYLLISEVEEGVTDIPEDLEDEFFEQPASYSTMVNFLNTSLPAHDIPFIIPDYFNRRQFITTRLLRYDDVSNQGEPIQGIGSQASPHLGTGSIQYNPESEDFTEDTHAVNVRYVDDFFDQVDTSLYFKHSESAVIDKRLKLPRFTVNSQSELNQRRNRIATLQNVFNDSHKHIRPEEEIKVGWVVRRPTPNDNVNYMPIVSGARVSSRGQGITTEDGDFVYPPNTTALENAMNAINSPSGSTKNRTSYVFINRKNPVNFNWGDAP